MTRGYFYAALAAVALALVAYAAQKAYTAIYQAGANACEAQHAVAAQKIAAEVERRETVSAEATGSMLNYLAAQLPKYELRTQESADRVRVVYRDRPVPVGCTRPVGVQDELDAARERASAAGRLRGTNSLPRNPSDSPSVGNGPVGR